MRLKGDKFYHQSRVPVDLQEILSKKWIGHSLKTKNQRDAERIENRLNTELQDLYTKIRRDSYSQNEARAKLAVILGKKVPTVIAEQNPPSISLTSHASPLTPPSKKSRKIIRRKLSELIEKYELEKKVTWSYRSKNDICGQLEFITKTLNDPYLDELERDPLIAWVERIGKDRKPKKFAHRLSSVIKFGHETLGWLTRNPAKSLPLKKDKRRKRDIRAVFTTEELNLLFAALQRDKSLHYSYGHQERYWVPLIMLYTGARVNEVCQLKVSDADMDHKVPNIQVQFSDEEENTLNENQSEERFRIKNENSERGFPVHPDLLTLGFGVYVKRMKDLGQEMLFPALKLGPNGYSHYFVTRWTTNSGNSSRWYNTVLGDSNYKGNHNIRHTFINMLKQNSVFDPAVTTEIIEEISGHISQSEAIGRYGKDLYLQSRLKVITDHIRYSFVPQIDIKEYLYEEDESRFESGPCYKTTYMCGEIQSTAEGRQMDHDHFDFSSYQRPDTFGYSVFHDAIADFTQEPASKDFVFDLNGNLDKNRKRLLREKIKNDTASKKSA